MAVFGGHVGDRVGREKDRGAATRWSAAPRLAPSPGQGIELGAYWLSSQRPEFGVMSAVELHWFGLLAGLAEEHAEA